MLLWDAPIFSKVFLVCFLIALLLEFGLLLLASMFLPDFDFVTGSGYFFLGVGSVLFRIHFFISKQNSSSVLLVVLPVSSVIFASPLSVMTVSAIYFSIQFIITFSYRLFLTVWYISPGFEFVSHVFVFTILKFSESIFMISFLDAFSQEKKRFFWRKSCTISAFSLLCSSSSLSSFWDWRTFSQHQSQRQGFGFALSLNYFHL